MAFVFPLLFGLWGSMPALAEPAEVPVRIVLAAPPGATAILQGTVVLHPVDGGPELRLPVATGEVSTRLAEDSNWRVEVAVPGFWARQETLRVGGGGKPSKHTIKIWPAGEVHGQVRLARLEASTSAPTKLAMTVGLTIQSPFRERGRERKIPRLTVPCSLAEGGVFSCSVPARTLDLVLRAEGFISHYFWDQAISTTEAHDLGKLELRPGASVVGRVEVEDGRLDPKECRVRVAPLARGGRGRAGMEVRQAILEVKVAANGFFQLQGLAPGTYGLAVSQPGFAESTLAPIEVWPRSESEIGEALVLRRPLDLKFQLAPPVDWLGRPWHALVYRCSDLSSGFDRRAAFDGDSASEGLVSVPGQAPGTFLVQIDDQEGNGFFRQEMYIANEAEAEQAVELSALEIAGEVLLGDEPLAALLFFGGRYGALRSKIEADSEGLFQGILPKSGRWRVEVVAVEPALSTVAVVTVDPDSDGAAFMRIALPDTEAFGVVRDPEGEPLAGAKVFVATGSGELVRFEADDEGRFTTRGLPEGICSFSALHRVAGRKISSGRVVVSLQESLPVGPIELRLQAAVEVSGTVLSPRGPVPGAVIEASAQWPPHPWAERVSTGLDGVFTLQVPEGVEHLRLIVQAPGYALLALSRAVEGSPPILQVAAESGTLELSVTTSQEELTAAGLRLGLWQGGLELPRGTLLQWAAGHGWRQDSNPGAPLLRLPAMAQGSYRACLASGSERSQAAFESGRPLTRGLSSCVEGFLSAGSSLELVVANGPTAGESAEGD